MRKARWMAVCLGTSLAFARARTAHAGTGREQEAFADETMAHVRESASVVRTKLGSARSSRDVQGTQCLDAKLTQLEVVQRQAEDARSSLRRGSLREDMDAMAQASAALTRLDGRAKELRSEADQCAGASEAYAERDERQPVGQKERAVDASPASPSLQYLQLPAASPASTPIPSTPFAPTPAPSASPYTVDAAHEASMLAYSADFTLAVFQVDKSLASVETLARELGGYLAQRA